MRAITVDPDTRSLAWENVPDPECGREEVLVDIHATAVNRADLLQRTGNYPPPPGAPPYMGLEMSGVVAEVGAAVSGWHPGDRVCALLSGGGYGERVAVPHRLLHRLSDSWDFVYGAAIPEVFYTAFVNLFMEAELDRETVLIHGGASGVGTAAIQLAREAGCRVLATAGSEAKLECCRRLGAELAINYKERDFAAAVREHCDGVDVILDIAGAGSLRGNVEILNHKGRMVIIALLGGTEATLDIGAVLRKRLRLVGSLLRSRSPEEKIAIKDRLEQTHWPALASGAIEPVIDSVLPVEAAEEAHRKLETNSNIGKVVLTVRE